MLSHLQLVAQHKGTFWLPEQASTYAPSHDWLFYFTYWINVIGLVGGSIAIAFFAWKFRRRSAGQRTSPNAGNHVLEIIWTIIPTLLFVFIFVVGFKGFMETTTPPANAYEIRVKGYKWRWDFIYPNGAKLNNELVVPVDTPVRLLMSSEANSALDPAVIHSFFVPAFRVKRDVLPYQYTVMWFEANKVGEYHLFCTEYCGAGHSKMIGTVRVVPQDQFEDAIKPEGWDGNPETLAEFGAATFKGQGCTACHSVDGAPGVGPTLKSVFNHDVKLTDGSTVTADENYIRESIMDPGAKIVDGFAPSMPTYAGLLTDDQIDGLIAYIKSLD